MAGYNSITLVGNLGRDPELRQTPNGVAVTSFSFAVNDTVKGEKVTEWFRVNVFGKQAESVATHLRRGREVLVRGKLRLDKFTDRDGKERVSLEVLADTVQFLGGGNANGNATGNAGAGSTGGPDKAPAGDLTDDDVPF